ncbi:hypothetical protein AHAS_Ahas12G0071600 [Arachis hypogaea]
MMTGTCGWVQTVTEFHAKLRRVSRLELYESHAENGKLSSCLLACLQKTKSTDIEITICKETLIWGPVILFLNLPKGM